ncbi:mechanosensitive ion channel family protein [Nitratifractor sp.]
MGFRIRFIAVIASVLVLSVSAWGEEGNATEASGNQTVVQAETQENTSRLAAYRRQLQNLLESADTENLWAKIYSGYRTYTELLDRQRWLVGEIFRLKHKKTLTPEEREKLESFEKERQTNEGKLTLLGEFQKDPFKRLLEPPKIEEPPHIGNPFGIITALSYLKKLKGEQQAYEENFRSLADLIDSLKQERSVITRMLRYAPESPDLRKRLKQIDEELETLRSPYEILKTTKEVYNKKIDEIRLRLNEEIKREARKAATIGTILLVFFVLFLLTKHFVRRYMAAKESFYTINKVINILFITLVVLVLLFAYIENVNYLVTILGFASAGIAIAMKDWFMSLMGWFVIVLGGAIHVGDRIKVVRDGVEYVGDVVDISLLRMTIQEDITLTTYMHNRRAGRIIFVPNNYVFTDMIANYSHAGLKTVWDGIDITVTFDSNTSKATSIAKEVAKKYSKGYTDITRKQLNKLRSSYHLKNTNVEPRVYAFAEPYGMRVSVWYLTNAFATLTLRSTISQEIVERFRAEEDIALAYPTQSLYLERPIPKPRHDEPAESENG